MSKKNEREPVNPKWLLREVMKALPKVDYVHQTANALWAHSDDFIEKDDIANGSVSFGGTVSYSQIADFCAIGESTAKWRMKQMRDKYQIVEWSRFKFGIRFTFGARISANRLAHCEKANGSTDREIESAAADGEIANRLVESANTVVESANGSAEPANGLATLAFLAESGSSGFKQQRISLRSEERDQEQEQHQEQPQEQARAESSFIEQSESTPPPVQPPAPQAITVPPAIPPQRCPKCKQQILRTEEELKRRKCSNCRECQRRENASIDWHNPVTTHDWSKDKDTCARCGAEREAVRYENIFCDEPQRPSATGPEEAA